MTRRWDDFGSIWRVDSTLQLTLFPFAYLCIPQCFLLLLKKAFSNNPMYHFIVTTINKKGNQLTYTMSLFKFSDPRLNRAFLPCFCLPDLKACKKHHYLTLKRIIPHSQAHHYHTLKLLRSIFCTRIEISI
jgi:hypothetical protein